MFLGIDFNKIFKKVCLSIPNVLPFNIREEFMIDLAERLVIIDEQETKYGKIKFYCFGSTLLYRSKTLLTKEPETIEWINQMNEDAVIWDIGANVGIYSIYAAKKGMKVYAFEPSALNTFVLAKNIQLNNLNNVIFYPLAISDTNEFGCLNLSMNDLGGSFSEFNKNNLKSVGSEKHRMQTLSAQGMFSYSIDELVEKYSFEVPNFIKIDVDSIEDKILLGAANTLLNSNLKGILIELDDDEERTQELIKFIEARGLVFKEKKHAEMFEGTQFETTYNYIFERVEK